MVEVSSPWSGLCPYTQTYAHPGIHACIHTHRPENIHTYICTYIHTFTHTYIHTHIQTYLHTYTRTYIHTYIMLVFLFQVHFISSFLWAPPAANQLFVLRAPPVSTLVSSCHLITSFLWGTACGDSVFCFVTDFVKVGAGCDHCVPFDLMA